MKLRFIVLILLGLILVGVCSLYAYYYGGRNYGHPNKPVDIDTSDWQTYHSDRYNLSFKYPKQMEVGENGSKFLVIRGKKELGQDDFVKYQSISVEYGKKYLENGSTTLVVIDDEKAFFDYVFVDTKKYNRKVLKFDFKGHPAYSVIPTSGGGVIGYLEIFYQHKDIIIEYSYPFEIGYWGLYNLKSIFDPTWDYLEPYNITKATIQSIEFDE